MPWLFVLAITTSKKSLVTSSISDLPWFFHIIQQNNASEVRFLTIWFNYLINLLLAKLSLPLYFIYIHCKYSSVRNCERANVSVSQYALHKVFLYFFSNDFSRHFQRTMKHVIFSNTLNHDDANMEGFAVRIVVSSGTFFFLYRAFPTMTRC
jgi:hypothetical protein